MQLIQITDKTSGHRLEEQREEAPLDLNEVKAKLAETNGQTYWRSLEELADKPGFAEMLHREFPGQAPKDWLPLPRREFVKLMGAALALAGLSGCAFQPQEKIVPYVHQPEEITPGVPLFYATAMPFMGYAHPVLAESHEGRPTKIEGNPDHPLSRVGDASQSYGATNLWAQASILDMYDPDRSQYVRHNGSSSNWDDFVGELNLAIARAKTNQGAGVAILTETITSPTQLRLIDEVKAQLPKARWVAYDAINRDNSREGIRLAFGRNLHPLYHFDRAAVVVSLDNDFLLEEPSQVAYARDFIKGRKLTDDQDTMNRLYAIESTMTITGTMADHRFPVKPSEVDAIARALAAAVGVAGVSGQVDGEVAKWVGEIAKDLQANRGKVLVVAGAHQPAAVHALAHAITASLGSTGPSGTISYHQPFEGEVPLHGEGLATLVKDMNAGQVQTLLIMGTNPAFNAPADLDFAGALNTFNRDKNNLSAHVGMHEDETSVLCKWHVPQAHYLESWGDARAYDGTVSLVQPLIQPLYEAAKSPIEVLAALLGNTSISGYDLVRSTWLARRGGNDNLAFSKFWQQSVHDGLVPGTQAPVVGATLNAGLGAALPAVTPKTSGAFEVAFRPDPTIWDGRYANNGWLQECPKPVSKTVWDNAVFISPDTAFENKWNNNDLVTITVGKNQVTGAIQMLPGQPQGVLTLHLGYGRTTVGKIGTGTGFDVNPIRTQANPWFTTGAVKVNVEATGRTYKIARTANYNLIAPHGKDTTLPEAILHSDEAKSKYIDGVLVPDTAELDIDGTHGRDLVRVSTFQKYLEKKYPTRIEDKRGVPITYPENPKEISESYKDERVPDNRDAEGRPSFYPRNSDPQALTPYKDDENNKEADAEALKDGRPNATQQWGMTVDLQSCIGCNSCVIACQSENNSAIVGKDQILMGRELHWIRIDAYYRGSYENPEVYFEPMMCQHCEKAPCAPVCPFNATMISPEGINEQVYNRCVGTKYCENNCPYKVRRFNFLQYSDQQSPVIQLMQNPDVTVRSRGVMEKCTYCIQRVNAAKHQAIKEQRHVQDGEIKTACQQSCPTNAIVFGDINDPKSRVAKLKRSELTFGILTEMNTLPRTSYLARIKNPNPALVAINAEYGPAILEGEVHGGGEHAEGAENEGAASSSHEAPHATGVEGH